MRLKVSNDKGFIKFAGLDKDKIVIGRSKDADIRLNDDMISRFHCEIRGKEGKFFLKDLGSKNGTLVNGKAVNDEVVLGESDIVRIGSHDILFEASEGRDEVKLENYKILRFIGKGRTGDVYQAEEKDTGRMVAIKLLPPKLLKESGDLRRALIREAVLHSKVMHKNIVRFIHADVTGGATYLVQEYLDGVPLDVVLESGRMPLEKVLNISRDIAEGLLYLHTESIVHRDVNPKNIMVCKGISLLVDLGMAKYISDEDTGEFFGSIGYVSPEQAQGLAVDHRTDIYSLGAVMYEMCTGRAPFDAETPYAIIFHHINTVPPEPRRIDPSIPHNLSAVIMRCMEKAPERRYQDISSLLKDLAKIV